MVFFIWLMFVPKKGVIFLRSLYLVIFPTHQNLLIVYLKPICNSVIFTNLVFHTQLLQMTNVFLTQFHCLFVVPKIWQLSYVYVLVLKWFHEKMYSPHFQSLKIVYGYLQTTFHLLWTVLKKSGWSSIWTIIALAEVIGILIESVYLPLSGVQDKSYKYLNLLAVPRYSKEENVKVTVMWTRLLQFSSMH